MSWVGDTIILMDLSSV